MYNYIRMKWWMGKHLGVLTLELCFPQIQMMRFEDKFTVNSLLLMVCCCEYSSWPQKTGRISGGRFACFPFRGSIHWHFTKGYFLTDFLVCINVGELFQMKFHFFWWTFDVFFSSLDQQPPAVRAKQSFRVKLLGKRAGRIFGNPFSMLQHWSGSPGIDQPNSRTKMVSKWSKWIWRKIFCRSPNGWLIL